VRTSVARGDDEGTTGQGIDKFLEAVNSNHTANLAVYTQFVMQVFGVQSVPPFGRMRVTGGLN